MNEPSHLATQRGYYSAPERKPRMWPGETPYVRRHLAVGLGALHPPPGARLLELGCGMGRFTLPLAMRGFRMTGLDLSPDLLEVLRRHDPDERVRLVRGPAERVAELAPGPWDGVVGFFFLHHLEDPVGFLASLPAILRPAGRIVFCEPHAFHPGFYAQILLTPGMTWRGDRGVTRMRRRSLRAALLRSGFRDVEIRPYGFLPPALYDRALGRRMERLLERVPPLRPFRAFLAVSAEAPGR